MAYFIDLKTITDHRGSLTVIEKVLPFSIKRVYYIYGVGKEARAGHRHKETIQATICVHGSCMVYNNNGKEKTEYTLDNPSQCLILEPEDWHIMHDFSEDAVLLVISSNEYDPADYIYEEYKDETEA